MGFRRSPPSFLSLTNKTNHQIFKGLKGVNFASGGSGILDSTVSITIGFRLVLWHLITFVQKLLSYKSQWSVSDECARGAPLPWQSRFNISPRYDRILWHKLLLSLLIICSQNPSSLSAVEAMIYLPILRKITLQTLLKRISLLLLLSHNMRTTWRLSFSFPAFHFHGSQHLHCTFLLDLEILKLTWQALFTLGARKFGIVDVPPIGCCPYPRSLNPTGGCLDILNELSLGFNKAVHSLMLNLSSTLEGMKYSVGSSYEVVSGIIRNPEALGTHTTTIFFVAKWQAWAFNKHRVCRLQGDQDCMLWSRQVQRPIRMHS